MSVQNVSDSHRPFRVRFSENKSIANNCKFCMDVKNTSFKPLLTNEAYKSDRQQLWSTKTGEFTPELNNSDT